jgi:two-component system, NarL family, invasion response regulator UvrY
MTPRRSVSPLAILLIEDHPLVRRGLRDVLIEEFPDVAFGEAGDSTTALQVLSRQHWDLALLDINIPGRDGLDVLEEMRRLYPETRVLIVSAYPEEEFAVRAFTLGAAGYLSKNQASDELVEAVRTILAGKKYVTASLAQRLADTVSGGEERRAPHEALSPRELLVLRQIAAGKSVKAIAAELSLSAKTVGTYRARIAEKTGLSTNVELTRYAFQHGLTM